MHVNPQIDRLLRQLLNPALPVIDLSLERMYRLLEALGNPHMRLPPLIHIAGTNGKGSTLAFLRAIHEAAGYRVHAYTSPHLVCFNERIVLCGAQITDAALLALLERIAAVAGEVPVTFFEATTAAAFLAFSECEADVVLLETGLGGRLDATNVVAAPALSILASIGMDHAEFLGDSIASIAREKAGILKRGVPCVVGMQEKQVEEILTQCAREKDVPLHGCGREWHFSPADEGMALHMESEDMLFPLPGLAGVHQLHNAALAVVAARLLPALPVSHEALCRGVAEARWPGRLQRLHTGPFVDAWPGEVYLDGGHNVHAAKALALWAGKHGPVTLVCGMMARKDARAFFAPLAAHVDRILTMPIAGEESHAPEALAAFAVEAGIRTAEPCADAEGVIAGLRAGGTGPLLVTGSLFLVGELLRNHG